MTAKRETAMVSYNTSGVWQSGDGEYFSGHLTGCSGADLHNSLTSSSTGLKNKR